MSTSIKKTLTYGKDYSFDVKAKGYYDYLETQTITKETEDPINITLKEYDGLKYTVDKSSDKGVRLDFTGTVLPYVSDNELQTTDYCLANIGSTVDFGTNDNVDGCLDADLTYSGGDVTYNCFANKNINLCLTDKESYEDYRYLGTVQIPGSDYYLNYDYTELNIPEDKEIKNVTGSITARDLTIMTYADATQNPTSYSLLKSDDGINFVEINNNITIENSEDVASKSIIITSISSMFNYNGKYFLRCGVIYVHSDDTRGSGDAIISTSDFENLTVLDTDMNGEGFLLYDGNFVRTNNYTFEVSKDLGATWDDYKIRDTSSPLYEKSIKMFISNNTVFLYYNNVFYKLSSLTFNDAVVSSGIITTPAQAVVTIESQSPKVNYNYRMITDTYALCPSSSNRKEYVNLFTGETLFTLNNMELFNTFLAKNNDDYLFYDSIKTKIINHNLDILGNYRCTSISIADSIVLLWEYDTTTNKKTYVKLIKLGKQKKDNSDPASKLILGDRIDNKATVVGNFTDGDGQEYVVAVLDGTYHGSSLAWSDEAIDSVLPNYASYDLAVAATESATYNMNQIETNYDITTYPAFNHCKTCTTVTFNNKEYTPLLPNAAEVEMINTNWSLVQGVTAAKLTQCWSSTEKHTYAWRRTADAWFNSLKTKAEYAVIPVIEIPIKSSDSNDSSKGNVEDGIVEII